MGESQDVGLPGWMGGTLQTLRNLVDNFGLVGGMFIAAIYAACWVWWHWGDLVKKPWIASVVRDLGRKAIPQARRGRLTIAITHLQGDNEHRQEMFVRRTLIASFPDVDLLSVDRTILGARESLEQANLSKARIAASDLRKKTGADMLLWGTVILLKDMAVISLRWTGKRPFSGEETEEYMLSSDAPVLPESFQNNMEELIASLSIVRVELLWRAVGHLSMLEEAQLLIPQLRSLLEGHSWDGIDKARLQLAYAESLRAADMLDQSIDAYRETLKGLRPENDLAEWAKAQYGLGSALAAQNPGQAMPAGCKPGGSQYDKTKCLDEAIVVYRALLAETRERAPLRRAITQVELAKTLTRSGVSGPLGQRLEEAVSAIRAAVPALWEERERIKWLILEMIPNGSPQNGLLRDPDFKLLQSREKLFDPEAPSEPQQFYNPQDIREAAARVPWVEAQHTLADALCLLGRLEGGTQHFSEAVAACREVLAEMMPRGSVKESSLRFKTSWALAQQALARALADLGEHDGGTDHLEESVAAYNAATAAITEDCDQGISMTVLLSHVLGHSHYRLGRVLSLLAARRNDEGLMVKALATMREAAKCYKNDGNRSGQITAEAQMAQISAQLANMRTGIIGRAS